MWIRGRSGEVQSSAWSFIIKKLWSCRRSTAALAITGLPDFNGFCGASAEVSPSDTIQLVALLGKYSVDNADHSIPNLHFVSSYID